MANDATSPEIERLIRLMSRLPGLGSRSARKATLSLLKRRDDMLLPLAEALNDAVEKVRECAECGNVDTVQPCTICADPKRDPAMLVVVEDVADLWALERAGVVSSRYHILGGRLSPLDGIGPESLRIDKLVERASNPDVTEVLLALNATVEGQSTMHYVSDVLRDTNVRVSEIQKGVPVGGELDYLDEGTLSAAIRSRRPV
ncbi:MAG: recombination mediator RecR [Pseudomonadota bacterium]